MTKFINTPTDNICRLYHILLLNMLDCDIEKIFELYKKSEKSKIHIENEIIRTILLLHPVAHKNNKILDADEFKSSLYAQYEFAKKIRKIMPLFDTELYETWVEEYIIFTRIRKLVKWKYVVPTIAEDFIWHSHMITNRYCDDCIKFYGYILDHNDTMDTTDLTKYITARRKTEMRLKVLGYIKNIKTGMTPKLKISTKTQTYKDDTTGVVLFSTIFITDSSCHSTCAGATCGGSSCGGASCGSSCGGGGGGD